MESWASPALFVPSSAFPRLELELSSCLPRFQVAQGVSEKRRYILPCLRPWAIQRGAEGSGLLPENHKWLYISLEILIQMGGSRKSPSGVYLFVLKYIGT